jgi:D,D-heptose 1,7-bisphosphate phosphatase
MQEIRTAVILAGGKGTRMGDLAKDIPKPMLRIAGKPLLQYQIEWLKHYGFTEVWLIINHLGDAISSYFGDGRDYGLQINYYREGQPLGTVGGIKALENKLKTDFLVLYGDVLMDVDFNRLRQFHFLKNSQATLVVHPNDHPYDSDLLELNQDDRVTAFHPKPHEQGRYYRNMVNAAMYIFSPAIFSFLQEGVKADFGKDIFPTITAQLRVYGYNTPEYIKDMGTPERLEAVSRDVISGKVARRNLSNPQKAIFLDRDGVINADKGLICRHEDFELIDGVADAIKAINQSDYLAIVVTNQPGIAKGMYDFKDLELIHAKMDTLLGEQGAKLDALYFCPHHPEKGFEGERSEYKIPCECRKPAAGMLLKAARTFNIDLQQSFMIGDHERDIVAGKTAGCSTIGVSTGHGLNGSKVMPDYFAENLKEAVKLILSS